MNSDSNISPLELADQANLVSLAVCAGVMFIDTYGNKMPATEFELYKRKLVKNAEKQFDTYKSLINSIKNMRRTTPPSTQWAA